MQAPISEKLGVAFWLSAGHDKVAAAFAADTKLYQEFLIILQNSNSN
jgi:hypothetical protein